MLFVDMYFFCGERLVSACCCSGMVKTVSWDAAIQTVCFQKKGFEIVSP